jgi:hypothetical protein
MVSTIWGPGEREGGEENGAERRTATLKKAEGPNWWSEPKGASPYGKQHFGLHFIAHLAVLINGKPAHRA